MPPNRRNTSDLFLSTIYGNNTKIINGVQHLMYDVSSQLILESKNKNTNVSENKIKEESDIEILKQDIDITQETYKNLKQEQSIEIKNYENEINDCLLYIEKIKEKYKFKKDEIKDLKEILYQLNKERINYLKENEILLKKENEEKEYIRQMRYKSHLEYIKLKEKLNEEAKKKYIKIKNIAFKPLKN